MRKKDYGGKYVCYQCGCRFYDLKKSKPLCPKCGVDQNDAPRKGSSLTPRQGGTTGASRGRMRKKKDDEWGGDHEDSMPLGGSGKEKELEEGLTLVDDDDLPDIDEGDSSEID